MKRMVGKAERTFNPTFHPSTQITSNSSKEMQLTKLAIRNVALDFVNE